ncbi:MAG: glycosyltransferase [Alphaproteobacteria bacterium]
MGLRIAYMLGRFPVLSETFIGAEIRAVEALGHHVTLLALHRPQGSFQPDDQPLAERTLYFSEITESLATRLLDIYAPVMHRLDAFATAQTTEPERSLRVHAAHMAEYIRSHGCTHIHAHFAWGAATYAIAAAKLLNMPITFTCHGSDVYARPQDIALKCAHASAVFAVSPTLTEELAAYSDTPCHTVYCGVDTTRFTPTRTAPHARWLFVGRLIECKGIDDILAAWQRIPHANRPHLDVVGDGPMKQQLEDHVRTHGLAPYVTFTGSKDTQWLQLNGPDYAACITAFKHGSDGSRDTAPMVLKEAMGMGLPLVTTRFFDIPAVVGDAAILCPPADPDALAAAVMQIAILPAAARTAKGEAGRRFVQQHFTTGQQAQQLAEYWQQLTGSA